MIRRRLQSALSPTEALLTLRDDALPMALVGRWAGGGAILASEPVEVRRGRDASLALPAATPVDAPEGFVGGGWFGTLGFGLAWAVEELPAPPPRPTPVISTTLARYDHVLRLDADGAWWFEALTDDARTAARLRELALRLAEPAPARRPWSVTGLAPRAPGYAGHRAAVADCVERIHAGEIFQANLCMRFEGTLAGEAIDAFAHACDALDPSWGAYVGVPGAPVVSLSPELFLRRHGRAVTTSPIKGTVARTDAGAAAAERAALQASAKDAAEHVMIVDLMRNDLGRVCEFGSVEAGSPRTEPHPGLWHLVTDVEGTLRDDADDAALLRATFPPGSVTGAPKVQALKVIAALEATGREAYTGAIGFCSPAAGSEWNVAIRTFETRGERIWLGAGGGIVADSDPDAEVLEAWRKAAPLARALGTEIDPPAPAATSVPPSPANAALRPDARAGLLETLAVRDGEPRHLDAHVARLRASVAEVFLEDTPPDLADRVRAAAAAATVPAARLRIVVRRVGAELAWDVQAPVPVAGSPLDVALDPIVLPGGLGAHKWADRRLVDAHSAAGRTPLLTDLDGAVLEAGWANVWIAEGDRLLTPPADGRLLAGITRARLLELHPRASEARLDLERVRGADAVLLTSSVSLATPAGPVGVRSHELAAELRAMLA